MVPIRRELVGELNSFKKLKVINYIKVALKRLGMYKNFFRNLCKKRKIIMLQIEYHNGEKEERINKWRNKDKKEGRMLTL